jgi:non-specific protein-tyrosine kinase
LQQHYSQGQLVLAQLELAEAQSGDFLRIVQAAQPNLKPVQPNMLLNTGAGLVAGLFLGMLLAVLFERLDTRVRSPGALTQLLDWPVLATVWLASSSKKEDVIHPKGRDANVESYRILRTNIGFSAIDKPLHSLVVTSALPRDGKSVIAVNLAIFMAKAGKNTLLIDADLRRPALHDQFSLSADKLGLSNAILALSMPTTANALSHYQFPPATSSTVQLSTPTTTEVSLEPFVHSVGIPNLWVMPSGPLPPNPPELLDSKAMQRLLMAIKSCGVEMVIFDTPPLLGLSDASILVSKVDGTLVVVDSTRANKGSLKQMQTVLAKAGANVLGCVINKQRRSRHDTTYSYYYYYYYHADEQNSEEGQSTKNGNTSAVPAPISTRPKAPSS